MGPRATTGCVELSETITAGVKRICPTMDSFSMATNDKLTAPRLRRAWTNAASAGCLNAFSFTAPIAAASCSVSFLMVTN